MKPALFLDRDGTITRSLVRDGRPFAPTRLKDFEVLPGVAETVDMVRGAGFPVIVITNQPDLTTGKQTPEVMAQMHAVLKKAVALDDIFVCPHVDEDGCDCRKPKPGLIRAAADKWSLDCARSVMVGDRWRDIEAGRAAGCATVFIDNGYAESRPDCTDLIVSSLVQAKSFIMQKLSDFD